MPKRKIAAEDAAVVDGCGCERPDEIPCALCKISRVHHTKVALGRMQIAWHEWRPASEQGRQRATYGT